MKNTNHKRLCKERCSMIRKKSSINCLLCLSKPQFMKILIYIALLSSFILCVNTSTDKELLNLLDIKLIKKEKASEFELARSPAILSADLNFKYELLKKDITELRQENKQLNEELNQVKMFVREEISKFEVGDTLNALLTLKTTIPHKTYYSGIITCKFPLAVMLYNYAEDLLIYPKLEFDVPIHIMENKQRILRNTIFGISIMIFIVQCFICGANGPLFLWTKSSSPFIWDSFASSSVALSTFFTVVFSKCPIFIKNPDSNPAMQILPSKWQFFRIDISEYLALIWQISIPGYVLAGILKLYSAIICYLLNEEGEFYASYPQSNVFMVILHGIVSGGLMFLALFPLDFDHLAALQQTKLPKLFINQDWNSDIHALFAMICFWGFAFLQLLQTASLVINTLWFYLSGLLSALTAFILPLLGVLNILTIKCLSFWSFSLINSSKYEWMTAVSIILYILLSDMLVMYLDVLGEGNNLD